MTGHGSTQGNLLKAVDSRTVILLSAEAKEPRALVG